MKTALRILRRTAAVINGLCVLALLCLLVPAAGLRAAALLQDSPCPQLGGWRLYAVADNALAPYLATGDLVFVRQRQQYPTGSLALCSDEAGAVLGMVSAWQDGGCTLTDAAGQPLEAGVPADRVLGGVWRYLPRVGGWLTWAMTDRGLATLVLLGVLLAELPAFLDPQHKRAPFRRRGHA